MAYLGVGLGVIIGGCAGGICIAPAAEVCIESAGYAMGDNLECTNTIFEVRTFACKQGNLSSCQTRL